MRDAAAHQRCAGPRPTRAGRSHRPFRQFVSPARATERSRGRAKQAAGGSGRGHGELRMSPSCGTGPWPWRTPRRGGPHRGHRGVAPVRQGTVEITVGESVIRLRRGDAASFSGAIDHPTATLEPAARTSAWQCSSPVSARNERTAAMAELHRPLLAQAEVAPEVFTLRPDYRALLITVGKRTPPSDTFSDALLERAESAAAQWLNQTPSRICRPWLPGATPTALRGQTAAHPQQRRGTVAPRTIRPAPHQSADRHLQRALGPAPGAHRR